MLLNILFLPMLIFIGIITSWEDYKFGLVRNKWIVLGLAYGAAVLAGLFLWNLIAAPVSHAYYTHIAHLGPDDPRAIFTVNYKYFYKVVVNSALSLLLVFLIWRSGLLAAGDGKLFFTFSLLLPLSFYWKSYLTPFPSFALLLNIFLPALAYLLAISAIHFIRYLYRGVKNESFIWLVRKICELRAKVTPKSVVMMFGLLSVFLLMYEAQSRVMPLIAPYIPNEAVLFLIIILLYRRAFTLMQKHAFLPVLAILTAMIYVVNGMSDDRVAMTAKVTNALIMIACYIMLLRLMSVMIDYYIRKTNLGPIDIAHIRPGMSLHFEGASGGGQPPDLGKMHGGGITAEQVSLLRMWAEKNNVKRLMVHKRFPFAVWMFMGVLITIAIRGAVTMYIFR